jgi:hypothetical protein
MDYRKLFQVLVVGGAVVGGTTGCSGKPADAAPKPASANDAGTAADAGSGATGGGVQGW